MISKLRYHETELPKISEKATIDNVDEHSQLVLSVFLFLHQFCYFFVGDSKDNHIGDLCEFSRLDGAIWTLEKRIPKSIRAWLKMALGTWTDPRVQTQITSDRFQPGTNIHCRMIDSI